MKLITRFRPFACVLCLAVTVWEVRLQGADELKPLMVKPADVVMKFSFDAPMDLPKSNWLQRQGTRWEVVEGVLRGRESSKEFQAKREHHFGYEPRLSLPKTPKDFLCRFSFRFIGGEETGIVPFVEFDHHVCRVRFSAEGVMLLSEGESYRLADDKTFVWESGKWYHALAERKGKEFVMQISDGPTLFAAADSFAQATPSGGNGFGIAGPKHGSVELDDLEIWSVDEKVSGGWAKRRSDLPRFEPVLVKKPKAKKGAASKKAINNKPVK